MSSWYWLCLSLLSAGIVVRIFRGVFILIFCATSGTRVMPTLQNKPEASSHTRVSSTKASTGWADAVWSPWPIPLLRVPLFPLSPLWKLIFVLSRFGCLWFSRESILSSKYLNMLHHVACRIHRWLLRSPAFKGRPPASSRTLCFLC